MLSALIIASVIAMLLGLGYREQLRERQRVHEALAAAEAAFTRAKDDREADPVAHLADALNDLGFQAHHRAHSDHDKWSQAARVCWDATELITERETDRLDDSSVNAAEEALAYVRAVL